jgi:ribosomal protein S18 acetylase RimI-like enzyme
MHIETAQSGDKEYISQASDNILRYHQVFDSFYEPVDNKDTTLLTREKIELVASEDGERVGCIIGVITYNPADRSESFAMIQAVWVEEDKRGAGIAHQLVAEFEKTMQVKNVHRIELLVDIRNEQGAQLWDSEGYQVYQEKRTKKLI